VHDHFEKGDCADANIFEVVGVGSPGFGFINGFLLLGIVGIESIAVGVDELDVIVELCYR
jgi:hypothetical protein